MHTGSRSRAVQRSPCAQAVGSAGAAVPVWIDPRGRRGSRCRRYFARLAKVLKMSKCDCKNHRRKFKGMLERVEKDVLQPLGVSFLRIDGSVDATQRFAVVQKKQQRKPGPAAHIKERRSSICEFAVTA
eukprot:1158842-Pelagomonas_calceolata.AAC.3